MHHTVEDVSQVKKKVTVKIPAKDVDEVLDQIVGRYRMQAAIPGFRKGKAPLGMVEKRFSADIYNDAVGDLINNKVQQIMQNLKLEPLTGIEFDNEESEIIRNKDFCYSFNFEIMPLITVPAYEGIGIEEEDVAVEDKEIEDVIERVRKTMAESIPVEELRLPKDDDFAIMDFAGFDEKGEPVDGVSGTDFKVAVGDGQVIPDFEALLKTIKPGEAKEGKVRFPDDYGSKRLAGMEVKMKITMKSLESRKLPEVDDEFAKKAGGFDTVEAMRSSIHESYMENRKQMARAKAQSLLLDKLLEQIEFPLPERMVENYKNNILNEHHNNLRREGKKYVELEEKEQKKIEADCLIEAEKFAKTQLFLLTVAKKEQLEVNPQELNNALHQIASRGGHDIKEVQEYYVRNNMLPQLRDRLFADKAMEVIYDKAAGRDAKETKKAPAKKEAAVKAPAKKEAAVKAPAKKEAAVKAPAKKEAAAKAPAKKEAAVKAPAKKEAAVKAPAKKSTDKTDTKK